MFTFIVSVIIVMLVMLVVLLVLLYDELECHGDQHPISNFSHENSE